MSKPFFFPPIQHICNLNSGSNFTIESLCQIAGIPCKASGRFTRRQVILDKGEGLVIQKEPGNYGKVKIIASFPRDKRKKARLALYILAYGLFDLVARESIRGSPWAKINPPAGRPRIAKAMSNAERQRRFRQKIKLASKSSIKK